MDLLGDDIRVLVFCRETPPEQDTERKNQNNVAESSH